MSISKRHTTLLAGFIGNVVEWYDFALYGYMAGILSGLFFPGDDSTASLIATYGIFAAGFLMRPVGSGVFGWLGDTIGRSKTMFISVTMMVLPTIILGCLPTYASVGILAPIMLVIVRLVQGLSVGGEFSSSVTYLVETAEPDRRGISGSWANCGSITGMLLGSAAAAVVNTWFPEETLQDWAWRLPFLFGGILGGISILLRRKLPESEHFEKHHKERGETSPLLQAFITNRKEMAQAILFASCYGAIFYLSLVYLPEWLHNQMQIARDKALLINSCSTALLLVLTPTAGWLSDRFFRRTHFIAGAMLLLGISAIPLYSLISGNSLLWPIIVQVTLVIFLSVPLGSAPALFVELFPSSDRLSGYSVAYNLGLGVVGGATPMFTTWLIKVSNINIAPSIILTVVSAMAFVSMLWIQDRSRESLL